MFPLSKFKENFIKEYEKVSPYFPCFDCQKSILKIMKGRFHNEYTGGLKQEENRMTIFCTAQFCYIFDEHNEPYYMECSQYVKKEDVQNG